MRLNEKWHAIMATAGTASRRITGGRGPTVSEPGVRATVVMVREATAADGGGATRQRTLGFARRRRLLSYSDRSAALDRDPPESRSRRDAAAPTLTAMDRA